MGLSNAINRRLSRHVQLGEELPRPNERRSWQQFQDRAISSAGHVTPSPGVIARGTPRQLPTPPSGGWQPMPDPSIRLTGFVNQGAQAGPTIMDMFNIRDPQRQEFPELDRLIELLRGLMR